MSDERGGLAARWICADCGDDLRPGTMEHCDMSTDHEEECEVCGELYMVGSDRCLTETRRQLRELQRAAGEYREAVLAVAGRMSRVNVDRCHAADAALTALLPAPESSKVAPASGSLNETKGAP